MDVQVHVDGDVDLEDGTRGGPGMYGERVRAWKTEDADGGLTELSVREDEQESMQDEKVVKRRAEQTWDGMEMEMEMD